MSPSIRLALRVLQLTSGATSPEVRAQRRKASLVLVREVKRNPEYLQTVRTSLEKSAAPADPALTSIKRLMVRAVPQISAWLQQQTDLSWGTPKGEAKYGYVQYGFYAGTKPVPTVLDFELRPSQKEQGKLELRLTARQGYSNSRYLASTGFEVIETKDLVNPRALFPSDFISKIKKAMSGSLEDEIESCVKYLDGVVEIATKATTVAKSMKSKLEALDAAKAKPADIIPILKEHWDITNTGRDIESRGGELKSISERLNRFL